GPVGTHVPGAGPRSDVDQVSRILADRHGALHLDERIRRPLVVHTDHRPRVTSQRTAFGGVLAGVEGQLAVVDDEPDGCDQGAAVGCRVAELSGAGAVTEESDYVVGESVHPGKASRATIMRRGTSRVEKPRNSI